MRLFLLTSSAHPFQASCGEVSDAPVFVSRDGKPLTRNGLDQILYRSKEWAGVKTEGGAHLFRHTFATMYLRNGGEVFNLSLLMGHTSVSTTEGYALTLRQEAARRELSVLDQINQEGRQRKQPKRS